MPRSLADSMRQWDAAACEDFLRLRPDLLNPPPRDMSQLAIRAASPHSLILALATCSLLEVRLLHFLAQHPTALTETDILDAGTAAGASAEATASALETLAQKALIWGDESRWHIVRSLREFVTGLKLPPPSTQWLPTGAALPADTIHDDALLGQQLYLFLDDVSLVLEQLDVRPLPVLRSGGVRQKELVTWAQPLQVVPEFLTFLLELAASADLIGVLTLPDEDQLWVPTHAAERWRALEPAEQWHWLVQSWFSNPKTSHRREGPATRVLHQHNQDLEIPVLKRLWLEQALAATHPLDPTSLVQHSLEERPLQQTIGHTGPPELAALSLRTRWLQDITQQAQWLGLWGDRNGALTRLGRVVAPELLVAHLHPSEQSPGVALVRELLPTLIQEFIVQADLSVIAPGPLDPRIAHQLRELSRRESRDIASIFRLSLESLTQAVEQGWTPDQMRTFLQQHSPTPLPQPLNYLIDDAQRRAQLVTLASATTVLASTDEPLVARLAADPALQKAQLRQLTPRTLISPLPQDLLEDLLHAAGYRTRLFEVTDETSTQGAVFSVGRRRAQPQHPETSGLLPSEVSRLEQESFVALARSAARILTNPPPPATVRHPQPGETAEQGESAEHDTPDLMSTLEQARAQERSVWVEYVTKTGDFVQSAMQPLLIDQGFLSAFDEAAGFVRSVPLARISTVSTLADPPDSPTSSIPPLPIRGDFR